MRRRDPLALVACLLVVRLFSALVPAAARRDWREEWEAEVRHRWITLEQRRHLDWRTRMDLFRRSLGALPDAAWLRRQFTADADLVHDARHGLRVLRKSPAFALSAIGILGLGIGGTVAIVALLDTLIFRPLPYEDADRVVTIWQRPAATGVREDVAPANFLDWSERARTFERMAAAIPYSHDYTGGDEPEVFFGATVTEGFFETLGVRPVLGRTFLPEEHRRGGQPAVLLTHGLWLRRFAGDPTIVNQAISLDGRPYTVVGVLPRDFAPQMFQRPGELGVWTARVAQDSDRQIRGSAWWAVVARLRPGVSVAEANAEMETIAAALAVEHPRTNRGSSAAVIPLREHLMGDVKLPLLIMLGAVLLVLLIGCANIASLLLARGLEREREFAIRAALGAGRARLVRQLVAESLLLSAIAAAAGVVVARWALAAIVALAPSGIARLHDAAIDGRILLFALALTTLTAMAFGVLPAMQFSRPSRDLVRERHTTGPRAILRRTLVAAEVALALVLLVGAGLLVRSFQRLLSVDPGFSPRGVVALQVFANDRNDTPDKARAFFRTTVDRMRALPGVSAAGAVSAMPFISANIDIKSDLEVVGRSAVPEADRRGVYLTIATPGYFQAMSISLREGRHLSDHDHERGARVAVISEALRRREWPGESPLGRRLRLSWQGQPLEVEIVGVVNQVRHDGLASAPRAEVFVAHAQVPFTSMTYVLKGTGEATALIAAGQREVWAVDPLQTFYDTAAVDRLVDASVVRQRFSTTVMSVFALAALALCAVGIYGIVSFTTAQRTREIGVRMALGADAPAIRAMVLREGSRVIAVGLGAGLLGALAGARLLQRLLFEVRPGDPVTLATVCAVLGAVGLAACYVPARRATRVDPIVALRID
jgi:putative ABC transport system permease protein